MNFTDPHARTVLMLIAGATSLPGWCTTAAADEIRSGQAIFRSVHVSGFDGEFLIYATARGDTVAKPQRDLSAIYVDSLPGLENFNRAERAALEGRYREAAPLYHSALGRARSFWKQLIWARYLLACDAAGDLDKAAEAYIQLMHVFPEKGDVLMPVNLKGASEVTRDRALERLDRGLLQISNQVAYWQLEALRLSILEISESRQAGTVAQEIVARLRRSNLQSKYRLQLIAIRVEVKHEQFDVALEHVNEALADAEEKYLAELLFLKGRCLLGLANDRDGLLSAGLAFMRVVIHYPRHRLAAESMYWAAQVHERIGRPHVALQLYNGCQELSGANDNVARLAQAAAAQLQDQAAINEVNQ